MQFDQIEHKLDKPLNTDKAVILLPGISGNVLSDERFNKFSQALLNTNIAFFRFELWRSEAELEKMTISEIHEFLNDAYSYLKSKGYSKISFVGKSFGGGIILTYNNPNINKLVLWSPAMNFGPDSNFIYSKEAKLYNFKKLSDIKINKRDLYHINYPVLIIHGTNDEVVSVENSKRIITEFPKIQLKVIEGADHSYSSDSVLNQILNDTVNFIK